MKNKKTEIFTAIQSRTCLDLFSSSCSPLHRENLVVDLNGLRGYVTHFCRAIRRNQQQDLNMVSLCYCCGGITYPLCQNPGYAAASAVSKSQKGGKSYKTSLVLFLLFGTHIVQRNQSAFDVNRIVSLRLGKRLFSIRAHRVVVERTCG